MTRSEAITELYALFGAPHNADINLTRLNKLLDELTEFPPAQQEPVAWTPINQPYPPGGELDILMGDGSILCEVLPQADGDLWWGGASTGERFIDPKYASVTHWRIHAEHTSPPAQRKPLTNAEIRKWWASENGLEDCEMSKLDDFEKVVRAIEAAHGIKGDA